MCNINGFFVGNAMVLVCSLDSSFGELSLDLFAVYFNVFLVWNVMVPVCSAGFYSILALRSCCSGLVCRIRIPPLPL